MKSDFGDWLNREIFERGWSQAEFARQGGISSQMTSMVLSGQAEPGLKFLKGTAKALGLPEAEVLERAGQFRKTGPILPGVADLNRRLLELEEDHREAALKALSETLKAIESVARMSVLA